MLNLLDSLCREIARNGFDKIVLLNAHGGNTHLLHFLAQSQLASSRDYVVYLLTPRLCADDAREIKDQWETSVDGHAGESETSQLLSIRPDLVHLAQIPPDDEGRPLGRIAWLRDLGVYTGIWWYADHPSHYRGDARPATATKGQRLLEARTRAIVAAIRAIKEDTASSAMQWILPLPCGPRAYRSARQLLIRRHNTLVRVGASVLNPALVLQGTLQ